MLHVVLPNLVRKECELEYEYEKIFHVIILFNPNERAQFILNSRIENSVTRNILLIAL